MPHQNKTGWRRHAASTLALAATLAIAGHAAAQAPETSGPRFPVTRFSIEGNKLLTAAEAEAAVAPFTGPARSFADVRGAVEALQQAYRQRGYSVVVVQLPEQELAQGVVRINVIEPRLGKVTVEGNKGFSTANIRASLPGLREGEVPRIRDISSSLKVANTNPAKQITLGLESGAQADTVDAKIAVTEDKPWRIGLNADNTGSRETGRTRLGFLVQNANLWDLDHVGSLQYTTSAEKPSKVSVFGAGYHVPLYALGDSLDFFASYSDVNSGSITAGVLDLQVSGKGTVLGARYNHTLPQRGDWTHSLTFGADWRAYKNSVGLDGVELGGDITVHPLSLTYAGQLALPAAVLSAQVTGLQNVPGGSKGGKADFESQRLGASASYRVLRYGAGYSQRMGDDWQLRLQFNGQATRDALVSGEQFGAGGANSVRGFREREVSADQGQFASVEIQTPNWCPVNGAFGVQCRALAFIDGANLSRNKALPGEDKHTAIASAGIGLRFAMDRRASLQIDYGRPIDGGGIRSTSDGRLHLALSLSY